MRKTKEICRLAEEVGLSGRAIARVCGISNSTVAATLSRLAAAGLSWPTVSAMSETELERLLYREQGQTAPDPLEPDWIHVRTELSRKHVTLRLLWEEYRQEHPDGYGYSWWCAHYRKWLATADPVMRQVHVFGEKVFVDWAGDTVPVVDAATGEIAEAYLFVAVLGASNYTFVEAFRCEDTEAFLTGHAHAFTFFGGAPRLIVCDNLKTGVKRPDRYEPDVNVEYAEMAAHYGCAVMPTRVRRPRDKAKVEAGVLHAYRMILAPLRNRTFFSFTELNDAIAGLLDVLNARQLKKMAGSRASIFTERELPELIPLPATPYHYRTHKTSKVHIDYHIEIATHRYSVPHTLIGQTVEVFVAAGTVEVYHRGERVAVHVRGFARGGFSTDPAHMPPSHREHGKWTPERIASWLAQTGPRTGEFSVKVMEAFPHPELGYRSCLGLVRLGQKHGAERLEAACAHALAIGANRYVSVKSILERGLDAVPLPGEQVALPAVTGHENLRGPGYYV